jgi:hypothetical protein
VMGLTTAGGTVWKISPFAPVSLAVLVPSCVAEVVIAR